MQMYVANLQTSRSSTATGPKILIKTAYYFYLQNLLLTDFTRSPESACSIEQQSPPPTTHKFCLLLKHLHVSGLSFSLTTVAECRSRTHTQRIPLQVNIIPDDEPWTAAADEKWICPPPPRPALSGVVGIGRGSVGVKGEEQTLLPTSHFGVSRDWRKTPRECSGGSAASGQASWRITNADQRFVSSR